MFPQTMEEVKQTNIILAVLYGLLFFLALILVYFAMMVSMMVIMPASMMDLPTLQGFVATDYELYSISKAKEGKGITHPWDFDEVTRIQRWTGADWEDYVQIGGDYRVIAWGERLVGVKKDELVVIDAGTIESRIQHRAYGPYSVAADGDGLAVISVYRPGYFLLTRIDPLFEEAGQWELPMPAEYTANECIRIHAANIDGGLWLVWRGDRTVYYAPVSEEGFGRVRSYPQFVQDYNVAALPHRTILAIQPQVCDPDGEIEHTVHLLELREEGWDDVPDPRIERIYSLDDFHLVEYMGNLQAFNSGFDTSWLELKGGEWIDRSEDVPDEGDPFKAMGKMMGMMMLISAVWLVLIPGGIVLIAHFHLNAKKDRRILMGRDAGELASFGRRSIAFLIDQVIGYCPLLLLFVLYFTGMEKMGEDAAAAMLMIVLFFVLILAFCFLPLIYVFIFEWLWGKTIGKWVMGLRVVMEDGAPCTMMGSLLRNLLRLVDTFMYFVPAMVSIAATVKYQRIGDLVAKTLVVREREGKWSSPLSAGETAILERDLAAGRYPAPYPGWAAPPPLYPGWQGQPPPPGAPAPGPQGGAGNNNP